MDKKSLYKTAAVCSAIAATTTVISYFLTEKLVSVAFDKKTPKLLKAAQKNISGSSKFSEILEKQRNASKALLESEYEDVETFSFDSLILKGHLRRCKNPKRLLIAFHGWRASWTSDYGLSADYFNDCDCDILFVEQRGQNTSDGDYMGFGYLERYDCLSWVNFVKDRGYDLPIYLVGISMGATTVLMASGLSLPDCVHGIIADCGFTSAREIFKHVMEKNLHLPYTGIANRLVSYLCSKKINKFDMNFSCCDALKTASIPILFIHGTNDHFVPVEMTYKNYLACASEKRLLIVPGADHGMSFIVEPEKYKKAVNDFWKDFD